MSAVTGLILLVITLFTLPTSIWAAGPNFTVTDTVKIADNTNGGPSLSEGAVFGSGLSGIGDLNGDGLSDLAVGAIGEDEGKGAVFIAFMKADGTVSSSVKIGDNINGGPPLGCDFPPCDQFGIEVDDLGDLNGDGLPDLAVGAYTDATGGASRGAVHILFMKVDGTVSNSVKITHNTNGGPILADDDAFGVSVSKIGDLNGDKLPELAVGTLQDTVVGGNIRGAIYVLFLKADGTVSNTVRIAHNTNGGPSLAYGDRFGISVSNIGDLNGDDIPDLIVGADGDSGGDAKGAVYVLFMKADGTASSTVKISDNTNGGPLLADGDHFGISMSAVDDLNGDGLADLMVGAFNDDTGGSDRGAVYLLFMQADGTAGSSLKIAHNTNGGPPLADGDWFGISVSDLGDLDGNGLPDLVSGVYQNSPGDFQGAVHVLFLDSVNPRLRVSKSVNDSTPQPGETITYTIIVTNTGLVNATGVVVSDTLPKGLNFVGPVRLDPPGKILPTPTFPVLASNLIITTNQAITLTFPVTLDLTAEGMITNIVAVASTEIITPVTATQVLNLGVTAGGGYETYLPLVVKDF